MARLLVLWLLSERPMHGYQIKKALGDSGSGFWFALEDASIYSVLKTLTRNGYAKERSTEKAGNRPARTTYAITAAGRKYYRGLLTDALSNTALPIAPIDVALAAQGDLDSGTVSEALSARSKSLHAMIKSIEANRSAAPASAMVDRNLALVHAELAWLEQLDQSSIT